VLFVSACAKDAGREQQAGFERDRAQLEAVVRLDLQAEHGLAAVGEAEKEKNDDEAALLLETSVLPTTDAAIAKARGAQLETDWGRARRNEMLAAMIARRAELPRYVAALRAHDFEGQLTSVQKQIPSEREAMQAAQAIQAGPDGGLR
jgi:hypothetical protein